MPTVVGDRYPDPELFTSGVLLRPKIRVPWWMYWPYRVVKALVKGVGVALNLALYRFGYAGIPALALAYLGLAYDWWVSAGIAGLVVAGLLLWWWRARESFWRWLGWFYLAQWRRWRIYQQNWHATCANLGLAMSFAAAKYYPTIVKVRRDGEGDLVTVRMLNGQIPQQWSQKAENFAHTFNADTCTVRPVESRWARNRVVLHLRVRDSLAKTVVPFPIAAVPDLSALPVAVRAGGRKVCISVITHVLIAGASGVGKGAVLWAILAALASAIRGGWVQVYAFDPKGGVELEPGKALFHRFYYGDPDEMAGALEDLVKLMKRRQAQQRGRGRTHIATTDEPAIVIVIDEFGALTSYVTDKKLKERINAAMSLILSQGRAIGVHVVAALQDPRKEILPFRNLFGSRIALRLVEKSEVTLILDDDALDRGAACHQIPKSLPGKGYMVLEGDPTPEQIRFPYHTDADIAELAAHYAAPHSDGGPGWVVNR
ncbi:FtsK/SpoIIIE domain-containing protein [Allorhizocola rhizosphaerae]|uniref:FtsK/SpoIIIE domain-containing protein n=1 Tax=Allorhizocola rhizosphaerae TaxID=1872709 RepID=UPI000E3B8D08|nr:FtsK/SpoIIIE domain-containing protein [Allorhizocola rhizosphaerae]